MTHICARSALVKMMAWYRAGELILSHCNEILRKIQFESKYKLAISRKCISKARGIYA